MTLRIPCRQLLDLITERERVLSNARVTCDDRDQGWGFAELLGRRKMHGVERANRLDRKRTSHARKYGVGDGHQIASSRENLKRSDGRPLVGRRQSSCRSCPDDGPGRLSERE